MLFIGLSLLLGFKIWENTNKTGEVFAKITYRDETILMIDLHSFEYKVYDTEYQDQVIVMRADEGIFYVPGTVTTDMTALYETDTFARDNNIIGVKLLVEDGKIQVLYQESPRDICQLQRPTSSSLEPLVCLPNELVVSIMTNMESDEFIPDSVLE
ncbi:MAG: NusG domain II-containing protein [Candidatus Izemoplasmatales bacterium]|nr:NusG domain II-containing protein [Candidatus Izemoplasmatales bacterium]